MNWTKITSRRNKLVKGGAALAASGEERRKQKRFLCEGARLCEDAARSGLEIFRCFVTETGAKKYESYLRPVLSRCEEAYLVEEHVAALLASTKNSQGIFCECGWPESMVSPALETTPSPSCIVLEQLQDPGNLGTVLRTAEALGIDCVFLLGDCCDPLSPKALRASMGAVFRLKLSVEDSSEKLARTLGEEGYLLHGAVPDSRARRVTEIEFSRGRHAVLIGNEGNGLREETAALCHDLVTIPMSGRAESLNASAAATILLWEMQRGAIEQGGRAGG